MRWRYDDLTEWMDKNGAGWKASVWRQINPNMGNVMFAIKCFLQENNIILRLGAALRYVMRTLRLRVDDVL